MSALGWKARIILPAVLLLTLGVAASLYWYALQNYHLFFGMYHDDAIYMVCAKALAQGQGYRIISLPEAPCQTKYPIGYSLFLAALWRAFPEFPQNLVPIELAQIAVAVALALTSTLYLVATRKATVLLAAVMLSTCLLNCRYIDVAPMILSDYLAGVLCIMAMWRTDVVARRQTRIVDGMALGMFLAAPCLVRLQALMAVMGCLTFLVLRRRFRLAAGAFVTVALVVGIQIGWLSFNAAKGLPFLQFYTSYFPAAGNALPSPSRYLRLLTGSLSWGAFTTVTTYLPLLFKISMVASANGLLQMAWSICLWLLFMAIVFGVGLEVFRKSVIGLCNLYYLMPIFIFPITLEWRHFISGLVLAYYFLFRAMRFIGSRLKPGPGPGRRAYQLACACASIAFAGYLIGGSLLESKEREALYRLATDISSPRYSPQVPGSDYQEAFGWIRANSDRNDVLICNADPLLFLYTGRRAVQPWRIDFFRVAQGTPPPDGAELEAIRFARPRYLMADPMYRKLGHGPSAVDYLIASLSARHPGSIRQVFASSHGLIRIFAIDSGRLPADQPADKGQRGG